MQNIEISKFDIQDLEIQDLTCKILKFQDWTCRILKFLNLVTHPWITHRDNSRYFTYGLIRLGANTCSLFSKMWQRAYLIRHAPLWKSRRRILCAVRVITIIWNRKPIRIVLVRTKPGSLIQHLLIIFNYLLISTGTWGAETPSWNPPFHAEPQFLWSWSP